MKKYFVDFKEVSLDEFIGSVVKQLEPCSLKVRIDTLVDLFKDVTSENKNFCLAEYEISGILYEVYKSI